MKVLRVFLAATLVTCGQVLAGGATTAPAAYHIYAGNTHSHTSFTWSHGEQWEKGDSKDPAIEHSADGAQFPAQGLALKPDGIFLSNGPGDPASMNKEVAEIRELLKAQVPTFGICFGHQLLGRAFGAETFKLVFGHRGGNQPVKEMSHPHVEITSHNHGFAVSAETLPPEVEVTHINLNDQCVEGMRHRTLPVISVQYHPEAAPGPHDAEQRENPKRHAPPCR